MNRQKQYIVSNTMYFKNLVLEYLNLEQIELHYLPYNRVALIGEGIDFDGFDALLYKTSLEFPNLEYYLVSDNKTKVCFQVLSKNHEGIAKALIKHFWVLLPIPQRKSLKGQIKSYSGSISVINYFTKNYGIVVEYQYNTVSYIQCTKTNG